MLSTIDKFYKKTAATKRLAPVAGNDFTEEFVNNLEDLACYIEPYEDAYSQDIQGNFGKDFYMFCENADILEGDKVIIDAVEYKVVAVEKYNMLGANKHMEIRIRHSQD